MLKWLAGYEAFANTSTLCERVAIFEPDKLDKEAFFQWFHRNRPDIIIGHKSDIITWLEEEGFRTPDDVGFFSLNLHHTIGETAGLNLQPCQIGAAAMEVLVSQIHLQKRGVPKLPYTTLLEGEWVDGFSIKSRK